MPINIDTEQTEISKDIEFRDKTPYVNNIERSFRVNVLSEPEVIKYKQHLFLDDEIIIVGVDVIRCATTSCAVLAAGGKAIRFYGKRTNLIDRLHVDLHRYLLTDIPCVAMGEFAGKPMPGGIAANSPRSICESLVFMKNILFLTKNLGDLCCDILDIIKPYQSRWKGEFIIGCLHNVNAVIDYLKRYADRRIVICCGGFRKTESIEDMFFTGKLIKHLCIPESKCDDAALASIALFEKYQTSIRLLEAIRTSRVSQVLELFGMNDDIEDSITGTKLDPVLLNKMANTIPILSWINDDPWFVPLTN